MTGSEFRGCHPIDFNWDIQWMITFANMRNLLITLVLGLIFSFHAINLKAQQSPTHRADSLTNILVDRHKKVNAVKMSMPGYRIQIYFGSERAKANEIRSDFILNFQQTPSYLVYHQPNFKVRVGDFRTRLEAMGFLKKLDNRYTTAFIVQDEVKLPDL